MPEGTQLRVKEQNTVSNDAAPDQLAGRECKTLNAAEFEAHRQVWGAFEHLACTEVEGLPPNISQAVEQARDLLSGAIRQEGWDGLVELEVSISDEMAARICQWHMKLMPHLLVRDEDDNPVCVPNYWTHPGDNYNPELAELLAAITADIDGWLQSLLPQDDFSAGRVACIYFHPTEATVMVGDTDYYLPLEAA